MDRLQLINIGQYFLKEGHVVLIYVWLRIVVKESVCAYGRLGLLLGVLFGCN
jgi:hypothetical protein